MRTILTAILLFFFIAGKGQQVESGIIKRVQQKLEKVKDYEAIGKMKLDVSFINAPESKVVVYYKRPDKFKVIKSGGISILPKGGVSINTNSLLIGKDYTVVPGENEILDGKTFSTVRLIPNGEGDIVLSKLTIDDVNSVIRKAVITTRENGTYEISFRYGKYMDLGLPDWVEFVFNTKNYKLPKGITFEYEKGGEKKQKEKLQSKIGKVIITYTSYKVNKGVDDSIFK